MDHSGTGKKRHGRPRRKPEGVPAWVFGVAGTVPVVLLGYVALAPLLHDRDPNDAQTSTSCLNVPGSCQGTAGPGPTGPTPTGPTASPSGAPSTPVPTASTPQGTATGPDPLGKQAAPLRLRNSFVSDLHFTRAEGGSGPVERDRSNGGNKAGDGRVLSIGNASFAKGLGVHAPSDVQVQLDGRCVQFHAEIGLDDEVKGKAGKVVFRILGDGRTLYTSPTVGAAAESLSVDVNVTHVRALDLVVDSAGSTTDDHADWADAQLACAAG